MIVENIKCFLMLVFWRAHRADARNARLFKYEDNFSCQTEIKGQAGNCPRASLGRAGPEGRRKFPTGVARGWFLT